jgi:hypothetical protein
MTMLRHAVSALAVLAVGLLVQGSARARRKVVDVAGNGVVQDQRQVRVRAFDFLLGAGFDVRINGKRDFVGLVNGGRFRLALAESVPGLQRLQLELMNAFYDLVEFLLQPVVGLQIHRAGQQHIEGTVKTIFCRFQVASFVVGLTGLVFLFGLGQKNFGSIGISRLRCDLDPGRRTRLRHADLG